MLRIMMTSMIANTEAAWSCLEYERSANMNPQCRRAFKGKYFNSQITGGAKNIHFCPIFAIISQISDLFYTVP